MAAEKSKQEEIDRTYGLEPVFEPGGESGSEALEGFIDVACPYCNEPITVRVDVSAGAQAYVEDCQVCCQPIAMSVLVNDDGQFRELLAERMD